MTAIERRATADGLTLREFFTDFMRGRTLGMAAENLGVSVSALRKDMRKAHVRQEKQQAQMFRTRAIRRALGV